MAKALPIKKWTVMVYLAGDNDLDLYGLGDLQEMKKVGSTREIDIVAQFDRAGDTHSTRRYHLQKGSTLSKDMVASLGETNTGDPNTLKEFIKWGAKTYPANHYLLVVWNHGAGWDDTNVYRAARRDLRFRITRKGEILDQPRGAAKGAVPRRRIRSITRRRFRHGLFRSSIERALVARAIAFDDNAQDFLDSVEIKKVLTSAKRSLGRKIDILGMDACLMGMAEVACQVQHSVKVLVGSEEVEPADGWPYDTFLAALAKRPTMTPHDLGKVIVEKYLASYPASESVTLSALDLSKCDKLMMAIDDFAKILKDSLGNEALRSAVMQARNQVQAYDTPDYVDLLDLCKLVQHYAQRPGITSATQAVLETATEGGFIVESGYKGKSMENSHGVAIYFPTKATSPLYAKLDFTKKTAWDEFLGEYHNYTSRRPNTA